MPDLQIAKADLLATVKDRNFSKLLAGQMIAAAGDRINQAALLSIVVYLWGNTAKYSADLMFWAALPRPIFSLFAIAIIDRLNMKHAMVFSDLARAVLAASIPLVMLLIHHHYSIYAVVFLIGVFSALFLPCKLAIMPNLLERKLLMSANAISSQAGAFATLLSMPIAGWIAENMGRNTSFLINAMTYLCSAYFVWNLRPSVEPRSNNVPVEHRKVEPLREFTEGLKFMGNDASVVFYVVLSGCIYFLSGVFMVCFLSYSVDILGQTVGGTNLLFAALGVGMIAGALGLVYAGKKAESFVFPLLMMLPVGAGFYLLSFIYVPWGSAPILFMTGMCAIMVQVPIDTFLQRRVGGDFRGRVFAAKGVLEGVAFLLSLQLSKSFIYHLGSLSVLKWLGVSAATVGVLMLLTGRRIVLQKT